MSSESANVSLDDVMRVARVLVELVEKIEGVERQLKDLTEQRRRLEMETLPQMLDEAGGLREFRLDTGELFEYKPDFSCSITKQNAPMALQWLADNGYRDVIKARVSIAMNSADQAEVDEFLKSIDDYGEFAEVSRGVHPQTLKAVLREIREAGEVTVPDKLFGIFPTPKVTFKTPKSPRATKRKQSGE